VQLAAMTAASLRGFLVEAKIFINGATSTLLAHAVFASVNSSRPSEVKNSADTDKLQNATTTSFRTDNDGH